jgi:hypothetical protein
MSAPLAILLDQVLEGAPDLELALDLAEQLGWRLYQVSVDPPWGGRYFVMLCGPVGPCVNFNWHKPEVEQRHRYSNATFKSLYGAVLIALLRGLHWERHCDLEVERFRQISRSAA